MGFSIELEEWVGERWHRWASRAASYRHYPNAAVSLEGIHHALSVFFRLSGGDPGLRVDAISERESRHRLSLRQRLGFDTEWIAQSRLDEEAVRLPASIDVFPEAALNRDLFFWLTAFFARTPALPPADDPLVSDILTLRAARQASSDTLEFYPGLRERYQRLRAAALAERPWRRHLPAAEAAVEAAIRVELGEQRADGETDPVTACILDAERSLAGIRGPASYRTFLPVPLWGQVLLLGTAERERAPREPEEGEEEKLDALEGGARKASRKRQDQSERDDPLVFNRFEKSLSFSEMVNLNRMIDDEPDDNASKTAEQLDELTLSPNARKAASRLQVQLDLAPEASIATELRGKHTYPEWDYRRLRYLPNQCQVLTDLHEESEQLRQPDTATRRRVRRIQRQFEALRPKRVVLRGQSEGNELDTDAAVRGFCDQVATGTPCENIYLDTRPGARDLAVSVLVDHSLSTDAWLEDRRIIDVIQEALWVLSRGLEACGDDYAITTFTSHRRERVWLKCIKGFEETARGRVERRIAALKPGSYTRMGPAIRHAAAALALRPNRFRLLLLLSDGKPNDTDYYEGRYAIEDTRRAVLDARQQDIRVFAITVDKEAGHYIPRLFGRGGYAMVDRPEKLSEALPRIYRQITGG
ncbi:MAG: nitric oxide reductase activation protein NorD [Parahaliea sp.]